MSLTAWRTYLTVCRLGSLTAAAVELGYTQSAVSRQVATLERLAGVQLLRREARGIVPTAAGEAFRHHARIVVNESDRAVRAARQSEESSSRITLGATPSVAAGLVPQALTLLRERHSDLVWTLITGLTPELESRVAADELDLALVTDAPPGLPPNQALVRRPLLTDEMRVIVPRHHPVARRRRGRVPLGDLAGEVWVEDNDGSAALLRQAAGRAGFEPRIDVAAADLTGKTAMVASGHAVALVPGLLVAALRRDVVAVRITHAPTRGVHVSTSAQSRRRQEIEEVVAALKVAAGRPVSSRRTP
jgi:DNA-binding transcriptional LysR family regulator